MAAKPPGPISKIAWIVQKCKENMGGAVRCRNPTPEKHSGGLFMKEELVKILEELEAEDLRLLLLTALELKGNTKKE